MEHSVANMWLVAGVAFLAVEALGVPGVGMLFAGIGALITGIGLYEGMIAPDAHIVQFTVFFIGTAASAVLLWKPLQRFRAGKNPQGYSNMIGDTAYVGSNGLIRGKAGEATWSGTIMKAELAPDAGAERLEAGAPVVIVGVTGATLIVKPKG